MELGGVALGPADAHSLTRLADCQCLTAGHILFLESGQLFRQCVGARNDIFKAGQAGTKQLGLVRLISDAGKHIGQVDQDAVLVHPAGAVQIGTGPAAVLIADLEPVATLVLQKSKGRSNGDGGSLGAAALGLVDGEGLVAAVPGSSTGHVQLKAAGGSVGIICVGSEGGDREQADHHDHGQQPGNRPFPAGSHIF